MAALPPLLTGMMAEDAAIIISEASAPGRGTSTAAERTNGSSIEGWTGVAADGDDIGAISWRKGLRSGSSLRREDFLPFIIIIIIVADVAVIVVDIVEFLSRRSASDRAAATAFDEEEEEERSMLLRPPTAST